MHSNVMFYNSQHNTVYCCLHVLVDRKPLDSVFHYNKLIRYSKSGFGFTLDLKLPNDIRIVPKSLYRLPEKFIYAWENKKMVNILKSVRGVSKYV